MTFKRKLLLGGGVTAIAIGMIWAVGGSTETPRTLVAADDPASADVPGQRILRYLGLDVPPSVWAERLSERDLVFNTCIEDAGLEVSDVVVSLPPAYSDSDELKIADPTSFEASYGYGVTQGMRNFNESVERNLEAASTSPPQELPTDEEASVATACNLQSKAVMDDYVAPTEVHQRYGALLQQASQDPRYLTGAAEWAACMNDHDFQVEGPFNVSNLVSSEAARIVGPERIAAMAEDNPWPLTANELDDLQEFELSLFGQDTSCRATSSLNAAMLELESEILAQLIEEFPDFSGAPA